MKIYRAITYILVTTGSRMSEMKEFLGKSVSGGIAIGRIKMYSGAKNAATRNIIDDAEAEIKRYEAAKSAAVSELRELHEKAVLEAGRENAEIFNVHMMLLDDGTYNDSVYKIITEQRLNAEYAVWATSDRISAMFSNMEDESLKARNLDIRDISERVLTHLTGLTGDVLSESKPSGLNTLENMTFNAAESKQSRDKYLKKKISKTSEIELSGCNPLDNRASDDSLSEDIHPDDGFIRDGSSETNPVILIADDLTPSELIKLDKSRLLAFVTRHGSTNSHTAILARAMGIPSLAGVDFSAEYDGKIGIVDGTEGKLIVAPDSKTLDEYTAVKSMEDEKNARLSYLAGKENVTKSGKKINIYANLDTPDDLPAVISNDAGGIGLFRSEFLYIGKEGLPTEEEQFKAYKRVLEAMDGKKVIIRTLDIGADKQLESLTTVREPNPAMGCRGIRFCLTRPDIFRTQLRALFRASAYGNLAILYPMIISVEEVIKIREISASVKAELEAVGITTSDVEEGIMIETPAAAIMSDELAGHADFFCVGTNDLSQYTMAIDRQNDDLDSFFDEHHPAVLRLIRMAVDNAHKAGIWAGICGELAADTALTEELVNMGVDELSVSPSAVLKLRKVVREME